MAHLNFFQWLRVILLVLPSAWSQHHSLCPEVGLDLFGDLLQHFGCTIPELERLEDKMKPTMPTPLERMKPLAAEAPAPPKWLQDVSDLLLHSNSLVNSMAQEDDNSTVTSECEGTCHSLAPQCCRFETRLLYPLYGRSLTSGRLVRIAQDLDPHGIQQPVLYRHCLSKRTEWVRGRCHQSTLPRLFFVSAAGSYPYRQDLVLVPSNCECILVGRSSSNRNDNNHGHGNKGEQHEDDDDNEQLDDEDKLGNVESHTDSSLLSTVEGSGTAFGIGGGSSNSAGVSVGAGVSVESVLQSEGMFRHHPILP